MYEVDWFTPSQILTSLGDANSDTCSIGVIGSGEGIDIWADQLTGRVVPDEHI
jgi:hypothetical protein